MHDYVGVLKVKVFMNDMEVDVSVGKSDVNAGILDVLMKIRWYGLKLNPK